MSQQPDIEELYAPWSVRLRGTRVAETYVGSVDETDDDGNASQDNQYRFEILLGIDNDTDDDESRIAIVARFMQVSAQSEVHIVCIAPIYVEGGVGEDLESLDGRWEALLKYAGFAVDVLWDFCRSSASAAVASSFTTFDIPNDMPDPILIKPLSLKE